MADKRKATEKLAIRIREEQSASMGDRWYHLRGHVRQYRGTSHYGHVNGWGCPDDQYEPVNGWQDLGFTIACQGDESSRKAADSRGDHGVYGWDVTYREEHSIDLRKVRKLHDTLQRLQRGLQRLEDKRGSCRTFGEYVGRVAEVIGADQIIIERPEVNGRERPTMYESLGSGVSMIDHLIYVWAHPPAEQPQPRIDPEEQPEPADHTIHLSRPTVWGFRVACNNAAPGTGMRTTHYPALVTCPSCAQTFNELERTNTLTEPDKVED